jgi:hypothetical protein
MSLPTQFVEGLEYESFRNDTRTVFAVTRCLEIISEASRRLRCLRLTASTKLESSGQEDPASNAASRHGCAIVI